MTDNEIIKALERCPQHRECCYCNSVEECGKKRVLTTNALDLINRQKAELELKTMDIHSLTSERDALQEMVAEQKAEIERLNAVSEICGECHKQYAEKIEQAKSEARKEFAERLKEKATSSFYEERNYVDTEDIDNLLKEMEGEE